MTVKDVGELVHSYVEHNDHQRAKKTVHFLGRLGYPDPDWIKQFMKKKNLSAKQATISTSSARYNTTKNWFIIFHLYDLLEKTINSFMTEAVIIKKPVN